MSFIKRLAELARDIHRLPALEIEKSDYYVQFYDVPENKVVHNQGHWTAVLRDGKLVAYELNGSYYEVDKQETSIQFKSKNIGTSIQSKGQNTKFPRKSKPSKNLSRLQRSR